MQSVKDAGQGTTQGKDLPHIGKLREEIRSLTDHNSNKDDIIADFKIKLMEASTKNLLYAKDIDKQAVELRDIRNQHLESPQTPNPLL